MELNKIYLGDCYELIKQMQDKSVDLIVTDPPYEIIGGGSGTTCLAAKHLGLSYIGFEINEKYYKIACDRLNGINAKGEMNLLDL